MCTIYIIVFFILPIYYVYLIIVIYYPIILSFYLSILRYCYSPPKKHVYRFIIVYLGIVSKYLGILYDDNVCSKPFPFQERKTSEAVVLRALGLHFQQDPSRCNDNPKGKQYRKKLRTFYSLGVRAKPWVV